LCSGVVLCCFDPDEISKQKPDKTKAHMEDRTSRGPTSGTSNDLVLICLNHRTYCFLEKTERKREGGSEGAVGDGIQKRKCDSIDKTKDKRQRHKDKYQGQRTKHVRQKT
jgi:hypothetical protein